MESILEQFLREEASAHVRAVILDAVREHESRPHELLKKFAFNRVEITLDFVGEVALIEDVLSPPPSGEVRLPLGEFLRLLGSSVIR